MALTCKADGTVARHWDDFDQRVERILTQGAKPVVMFSFMPQQIAAVPRVLTKFPEGGLQVTVPEDALWGILQLELDNTK